MHKLRSAHLLGNATSLRILQGRDTEEATVSEWQPIKTAPKDGTAPVDLWVVSRAIEFDGSVHDYSARRLADAWWVANEKLAAKGEWRIRDEAHEKADEDGYVRITADDAVARRTVPTHWMPVPNEPTPQPSDEVARMTGNVLNAESGE
jgi:hypothetical protein